MKQNNQQITKRKAAITQNNNGDIIGAEEAYGYSGPIPHPDILKGFYDIDKSFPERIIKIAENHAATEDEIQRKLVKGNIISTYLGQILSFLFGIIGIGSTILLAIKGLKEGAIASSIAVMVQVVVSGIVSSKNNKN